MAKYVYKNTHFFITMDPKRTIKMSLKVLYAGWGPTAYHSMTFAGLYTFQVRHARLQPEATTRNQFYLK